MTTPTPTQPIVAISESSAPVASLVSAPGAPKAAVVPTPAPSIVFGSTGPPLQNARLPVNGNTSVHQMYGNSARSQNSVTMATSGPNSYAGNGIPMMGNKNIQFGFSESPAPALNTPHKPDSLEPVPSPQLSPSPIPQPSKSGGVPSGTSSDAQTVAFGAMNLHSGDHDRHMRPGHGFTPQQTPASLASPGPHPHNYSSPQADAANVGLPGPGNRPGFGRGRGYNNINHSSPQFSHQGMRYPSHSNFQPGQGRGMSQGFNQNRQSFNPAQSPAMVSAIPVTTPKMSQASLVPMSSIPQYHYPGPPQPHHGPPPPMQQVRTHFIYDEHLAPTRNPRRRNGRDTDKLSRNLQQQSRDPSLSFGSQPEQRQQRYSRQDDTKWPTRQAHRDAEDVLPDVLPSLQGPASRFPLCSPRRPEPLDLSPQTGQFDQLLMDAKQNLGSYPPYMPSTYYPPPAMYQPNAHSFQPYGPQSHFQPAAAHAMSRQSSHSERPTSSASNQQQAQAPVVVSSQQPSAMGTPSMPSSNPNFVRPPKRVSAIPIKNAQGVVLDLSHVKAPASPVPIPPLGDSVTTSPSKASAPLHHKTESVVKTKTTKEIQDELREKVGILAARDKAKVDDPAATSSEKENLVSKTAPTPAPTPAPEPAPKPAKAAEVAPETEKKKPEEALEEVPAPDKDASKDSDKEVPPVAADTKPEVVVDEPKPAEPEVTVPETKPAEPEEDEIERMIREMEEADARREKEEEEHRVKKQAEKEASEAQQDAQKKTKAEENDRKLREAEREMERLEEEKERRRNEAEESGKTMSIFDALAQARAGASPSSSISQLETSKASAVSDVAEKLSGLKLGDSKSSDGQKATTAQRAKPAALNLKTLNAVVEPPQPSAALQSLKSARFLSVIDQEIYPPGIHSPNPALNAAVAKKGKTFKYDANFLLQFQKVFIEQPSLEFGQQVKSLIGDTEARSASAKGATAGSGRNLSRGSGAFQQPMGAFGSLGAGRGVASSGMGSIGSRQVGSGPVGSFSASRPPFGSGVSMSRTASQQNVMPHSPSGRQLSRQGTKNKGDKAGANFKTMPLTQNQDIKPLQPSSGGWKPMNIGNRALQAPTAVVGQGGHLDPGMVQRKVKAALNKMTPEKFDKISDQILDIAAQSKDENDGRTLRQVIQLTFEKATDEAHWASMYARFCKRMLDQMDPSIHDDNIKDKNGNVVSGGTLFRKYLLNRCQEEFERGWSINLPELKPGETKEAALLSDEYYIAAAAKRRGLGLVQFIGELFKLHMLTERIMHECVHKLVDFQGIPDEAEVESLSKLLKTIGNTLEAVDKKGMMDAYFDRVHKMMDVPELPSRMRFMLMDIVDLRKAGWVSKETNKGPKTLDEVRAEAEALAAQKSQEAARSNQRGPGSNRLPMGRQDARQFSNNFPQQTSNQVGVDDLRRLKGSAGRSSGQGPAPSFAPTALFSSRSNSGRRLGPVSSLSRHGDESGVPSRAGTPGAPAQTNQYSLLATMDPENLGSPPSVNASPALPKATLETPPAGENEKQGD